MKSELFKNELNYIEDEKIRRFAEVALDNLPDYFFEVAASSTGKYHPQYALGKGGLVRHTKAAVRFANHMFQTEQMQNKFDITERSYAIAALLLHDGWKHGEGKSMYTIHEHPQVAADWVLNTELFDEYLPRDQREVISSAIASHMGQWNTTKRSKFVLEKPTTDLQQFVHMCDYLASRKDIEVVFEESETAPVEDVKIEEFKMPFGKHKGQLLLDVAKTNKDYLVWCNGNLQLQEPLKGFISQLL